MSPDKWYEEPEKSPKPPTKWYEAPAESEDLSYQSLRTRQRQNLFLNIPTDYDEIRPDWWKLATHVGKKDDKIGELKVEAIRQKVFEEGRNLNEIRASWRDLTLGQRRSVANILSKAGVLDEMMIEEFRRNRTYYEGSPVDEAAQLSRHTRMFAPAPLISVQEGAIPPRYKWKSLGKIGFFEGFTTTKWVEKIPFFGAGVSMGRVRRVRQALEALREESQGKRELSDDEHNQAKYHVDTFFEEMDYMAARGHNFGGKLRNLVIDMIPHAAEFALIGAHPWVQGAREAAIMSIKRLALRLGMDVTKKLPRLIAAGTGALTEASVRSLLQPARIGEAAERAMLEGSGVTGAVITGFADTFIENLSEMSGSTLRAAAKKMGGIPRLSRLMEKLEGGFARLSGSKLHTLLIKAGYHGPIEEKAEERFGEFLRSLLGTENFGLDKEEANFLTRWLASRPDLEQHLVELIGFAVPAIPAAVWKKRPGVKYKRPATVASVEADLEAALNISKEPRMTEEEAAEIVEKAPRVKPEVEVPKKEVAEVAPPEIPVEPLKKARLEPHEITFKQYRKLYPKYPKGQIKQTHKAFVELALQQNLEVPQKVLAQYPELATKYKQTIMEWKARPPKKGSVLKRGLLTIQRLQRGDFDTHELTERELNRIVFSKMQRVSREVKILSQKQLLSEMARLVDYAKSKLPPGQYQTIARVMERVSRVRTPSSMQRFVASVDAIVQSHKRKQAEKKLKTQLKILKKTMKTMLPDHKERAQILLDTIPEKTPLDTTVKKALSVLKAMEKDAIGEIPVQLGRRVERSIREFGKARLRDLPAEEIENFTAAVMGFLRQQRLKKKYLLKGMVKEARELEKRASEEIYKLHKGKYKIGPEESEPRRRIRNKLARLLFDIFKGQELDLYELAGEKSAVYDLLFERLLEGQSKTGAIATAAISAVVEEAKRQNQDMSTWKDTPIEIPLEDTYDERGRKVEVLKTDMDTHAELVAFIMDPENRAEAFHHKYKGDHLWDKRVAYKFSIQDWLTIIKTLPPAQRAVIDAAMQQVEGPLWDAANEAHVKLRLYELKHNKYHWARRRRAKEGVKLRARRAMKYARDITGDDIGLWKERVNSPEPCIHGLFTRSYAGVVQKTAAYAGKTIPTYNARQFVRSKVFKEALQDNHPRWRQFLKDQEDLLDEYEGMEPVRYADLDQAIKWLTRNAHSSLLGLRLQIILYQFSSVLQATNEIKPSNMLHPSVIFKLDHKDTLALIDKYSKPLANRNKTDAHSIITPDVGMDTMRCAIKGESSVDRVTMGPIHFMDTQAIVRVVDAALRQVRVEQGVTTLDKASIKKAMRLAEKATYRSQPSWDPLITPKVMRLARRQPLWRLAMMFSGQRAQNFQMMFRAVAEYKQSARKPADKARAIRKFAIPAFVNGLTLAFIYEGVDWIWGVAAGDDDRDFNIYDVLWGAAYRSFGNWLIFGDYGSEVLRIKRRVQQMRTTYGIKSSGNVVANAIENAGMAIVEMSEALELEAKKYRAGRFKGMKRSEAAFIRALERALKAQGIFTGLPAEAIRRPLEPLYAPRTKRKRK